MRSGVLAGKGVGRAGGGEGESFKGQQMPEMIQKRKVFSGARSRLKGIKMLCLIAWHGKP